MGCEGSALLRGDGDTSLSFQLLHLLDWCHRVAFELGELAIPYCIIKGKRGGK